MRQVRLFAVVFYVSTTLSAAIAFAAEPIAPVDTVRETPAIPKTLEPPRIAHPESSVATDEEIQSGAPIPAAGTTLSPPVTITYAGSSNAVTINDSGTNRGVSSSLTNSSNSNSALYGETKGKGAGVKGVNSGTGGSGGVFAITDSASIQPALSATTNGSGSAISAMITRASDQPVIIGSNEVSNNAGVGVEGVANLWGVFGFSGGKSGVGYGVFGYSDAGAAGTAGLSSSGVGAMGQSGTGYGVYGQSSANIGVYGYSEGSYGVYALGYEGDALYASSTYGRGMTVHSVNALGIYASSDSGYGIWGQSHGQYGVIGEDSGGGIGVYGSSVSGYAGYFAGKVAATSYLTVSDRNAKTDLTPIDGAAVLERVSALPITEWSFKEDRSARHMGPMAQDFHAAFGLDGQDDTHISLSDAAGVSLAAIQELNKRLQEKDAQVASLQAQVALLNERFGGAPGSARRRTPRPYPLAAAP
jgi:hypothetical protein